MKEKLNKKGELGLDTVKTVILALLIIGVFAVALFLTFSALLPAVDSSSAVTASVKNETTAAVTEKGVFLSANSLYNPYCSIERVTSDVDKVVITAANYTISNCKISAVGPLAEEAGYNNTKWNVTYSKRYSDPNAFYVTSNISGGTTQFFNNIPTIMSILGAVVIILAVVLILYAVNRFGAEKEGGL